MRQYLQTKTGTTIKTKQTLTNTKRKMKVEEHQRIHRTVLPTIKTRTLKKQTKLRRQKHRTMLKQQKTGKIYNTHHKTRTMQTLKMKKKTKKMKKYRRIMTMMVTRTMTQ